MVWGGNGKIYFFKGNMYWKYDPKAFLPVDSAYPREVSNWEGIPNSIDAALQYSNGYTYFFKNGHYWRFNDAEFRVDDGNPSYPRPTGSWWYGCEKADSTTTPKSKPTTLKTDDDSDSSDTDIKFNTNDNYFNTLIQSLFNRDRPRRPFFIYNN